MRQVLLSPDTEAVAIRTDHDADGNQAWAVIHVRHGGAWTPASAVDGWTDITPNG